MDKKSVKTIIEVVLGLTLVYMFVIFISLIFTCISIYDMQKISDTIGERTTELLKWMLVAIVCLFVPTFVSYIFAYFGNAKIFNLCAAVMSLLLTATVFSFIFVLRNVGLDSDLTLYTSISTMNVQFAQLLATLLIADAYFIFYTVKSFISVKDKAESTEATCDATCCACGATTVNPEIEIGVEGNGNEEA